MGENISNYASAIKTQFVWFRCMTYYFIFARRWYIGPKMTVGGSDSITSDNIIVARFPYVLPIDEPRSFDYKKE